ncbi:MAG: hypothetical protein ACP5U1_07945 [Desulfomonilaceae bacterium]
MKSFVRSIPGENFYELRGSLEKLGLNQIEIPIPNNSHLLILEKAGIVEGILIWSRSGEDEVDILKLAVSEWAKDSGFATEFVRRGIIQWAELKILKAGLVLQDDEADRLTSVLVDAGFAYEGLCWSPRPDGTNSVKFAKKFVYGSITSSELLDFLQQKFVEWGYETKLESNSLSYRTKRIYQHPFLFPSWHKIGRQGASLVVTPPARPLEFQELETLLFPLIVKEGEEKPVMVTIERKRAASMIELPMPEEWADNLFSLSNSKSRQLNQNLVYTFPTGFQDIRRGLPVLFYVNGVGAVGEARIASWSYEKPKNAYNLLSSDEKYDLDHIREHAGQSGPKAGKVLLLWYRYYRVFKRAVELDQMKRQNNYFKPQRLRSISYDFFDAITEFGNK